MKALIQRVSSASVSVNRKTVSRIGRGLLLLVGVAEEDSVSDVSYLAKKIANLRIFEDKSGKMNLDIKDVSGEVLSVPQFTLLAEVNKGNRPGFDKASRPEKAFSLWKELNKSLRAEEIKVEEGSFREHMSVELVNDGPVTIMIDSRRQQDG